MKKIIIALTAVVAMVAMTSCDTTTEKLYYYGIQGDTTLVDVQAGSIQALQADLTAALQQYSGQTNVENVMKVEFFAICSNYDGKIANGNVYLKRSAKLNDQQQLVNPTTIATYNYPAK